MSDIIYTPPASPSGPTGSGSAGQVTFWSASTVLTGSNELFFDAINNRLGVGTITPSYKLDVNGTARIQTSLQISGAVDGSVFFPNTVSGQQMKIYSQYASNALVIWSNGYNLNLSGGGGMTSNFTTTITGSNGSPALTVQQGNVAWTPVLKINAIGSTGSQFNTNGNVLIGTTTDAGYKFQVNGTAYLNNTVYLGNARVGFSQTVPYFDIVASFTGGAGFSIGFVDNNNTNRWAVWRYNGSVMSDYTSTPTPVNSSVQFQLDSITRGFLLARMTDAQILAISSPADGLMVYSTDQHHIAFYDSGAGGWKKLSNSNL